MPGNALPSRTLLILLVLLPLLNGCLSAPSAADRRDQALATERLSACLERQRGTARTVALRVTPPAPPALHRCEGHRRDVVRTYPRHYSRHIDALLEDAASRHRMP